MYVYVVSFLLSLLCIIIGEIERDELFYELIMYDICMYVVVDGWIGWMDWIGLDEENVTLRYVTLRYVRKFNYSPFLPHNISKDILQIVIASMIYASHTQHNAAQEERKRRRQTYIL